MLRKLSIISLFAIVMIVSIATSAFAAVATPTGLAVTASSGTLTASWDAVGGATGYNIYVDGVKHNTSDITATSYVITGLTNGTSYSITVTSLDGTGTPESAQSSAVTGTPSAGGAGPSTGDADVDAALTAFETAFSTVKSAFWYLALAAIPITLAVLAFFWLRGKFKQAVSGS